MLRMQVTPARKGEKQEGKGRGQGMGTRGRSASPASPMPSTLPPLPAMPALLPVAEGQQVATVTVEVLGPASVAPGQPYAYEIVVHNNGPTAAYDVHVTEVVSPGARYLNIEPRPTLEKGQLAWDLGNLPAEADRRLRIQSMPPAVGELASVA